ncbi:MAG TPA: serine hydrolase domain-containing protein [Usitatibacter sp.]|jgi:CubicO group peptidase (beta-lactamase class C family)|nr:serine hydrolase domain-containing protein [Usitatibacter sp.]
MPAALLLALLLVAAPMAAADPLDGFLHQTLESARARHHVPGAAVLVELDGAVAAQAAGFRAEGHPERVTVDDRWHIGSDTKAFTATMIMRLAERGVLSLDETLARCLPDLAASMDPAYREVTLAQLLSHTAGLPPLTDPKELPAFFRVIEGVDGLAAQRAAVARHYLSLPSASKPGAFAYSNLGYIIAGSIAESRTGKTWEDLVRTEVFAPLGITQAGFGPPGTAARIDQPRGHQPGAHGLRALEPGAPGADNPPALGPAGTINISLADWARFARDQMDGALGHGKLLTAAGYRRLQAPVTGNYALGWGAKLGAGGVPVILAHTGSNGNWLADIRIRPMDRLIELIALNAADEGAKQALDEIQAALRARIPAR